MHILILIFSLVCMSSINVQLLGTKNYVSGIPSIISTYFLYIWSLFFLNIGFDLFRIIAGKHYTKTMTLLRLLIGILCTSAIIVYSCEFFLSTRKIYFERLLMAMNIAILTIMATLLVYFASILIRLLRASESVLLSLVYRPFLYISIQFVALIGIHAALYLLNFFVGLFIVIALFAIIWNLINIIYIYKFFTEQITLKIVPKRIADSFCKKYGISSRETDVLNLLLDEYTYSQMAAMLFISKKTIERHVTSIYRKCSVSAREELVKMVIIEDMQPLQLLDLKKIYTE